MAVPLMDPLYLFFSPANDDRQMLSSANRGDIALPAALFKATPSSSSTERRPTLPCSPVSFHRRHRCTLLRYHPTSFLVLRARFTAPGSKFERASLPPKPKSMISLLSHQRRDLWIIDEGQWANARPSTPFFRRSLRISTYSWVFTATALSFHPHVYQSHRTTPV